MTEVQSEAQVRADARESHLEWLRGQHADFAAAECSGPSDGLDFAVGGEVVLSDAEPVYRSLSLAGPSETTFEYEEEPVYRSMDLAKMTDSMPSPSNAEAEWLKQKRPPLLRRQNAFAFSDSQDPEWLGMLGGAGTEDQESGR